MLQRLVAGDGPLRVWSGPPTLDRIVAERALISPEATAVADAGIESSYAALLERTAELAGALRERQVVRGARVGICGDASVDFFAAILAIWSIGATYVPLDPLMPKSRLEHIVTDAAISLVLVDRAYLGRVAARTVVVLDEVARDASAGLSSDARPGDAAYIVYTSGSTGVPKGVEVPHAALTNVIRATQELCPFEAGDRQFCRTSAAFDVSFYEMFGPLCAGATLVVARRSVWADPRACAAFISDNAITSLFVTPGFLAILLDEPGFKRCSSLRVVGSAAEALSVGLYKRFVALSSAELWNWYGPSEATVFVTYHRCERFDAESIEETVPIGRALANTHVSVRDPGFMPVEPGGVGEIVIGGIQLASGYVNKPDENAARFLSDPLRPHERLYRTGDLARLRHDGKFVFLGRNDKQVKIRGQRVEPAEVGAAFERIDGVRTAAVLARRDSPDAAIGLIAYVVPRAGALLEPRSLRRALRAQLPPAMVPAQIVIVDGLPLTIAGKIDEAALHERERLSPRESLAVRPSSEDAASRCILHEQIRVIWEDLLNVAEIGDDDDFFELGGDSLSAVHVMKRLEETFGSRIPFADFFDAMTIAGLGELVSGGRNADEPEAVRLNERGTQPPLVFLHGDFAGGMYAWSLAKLLGEDQPLLVIPPHGMHGRPPATDVETMAADVAAVITQFHPEGPLRIAGYSAAGFVAYEAARLLRLAGRDVADVVLIGTAAGAVAYAPLETAARRLRLPRAVRDALLRCTMGPGLRLEQFVRLPASERWSRLREVIMHAAGDAVTRRAPQSAAAWDRYVHAHETYIPGSYEGRMGVLWPNEQRVQNGDLQRDWSRVAPGVDIAYVPGSHHTAVSRHVAAIAAALRDRWSSG